MDANKLAELRQIDYRIQPSCGLCKHGQFIKDDWGGCRIQTYVHLKHTGEKRLLSIHRSGHCSKFEPSTNEVDMLGAYREFLK